MTLPHNERLMCRCGIEVKIARLVPGGLGHVTNPKDKHHPIRLLRLAKPASEHPGVLARTREPNSAPSLEGPSRRTRDEARSEPGSRNLASVVPDALLREHLVTQPSPESRTSSATPLPPFATPVSAGRSTAGD
jgi:hypothetical protein